MSESQNIEYKESWRDEYLKWICGFANAQGGRIYIGISDNQQVIGVTDSKKLMEDIPNKIVNYLGIVADVNLMQSDEGKDYIEIVVEPSNIPIAYHGQYHFRSGSTKQELKGVALQQFILKKMGISWDDIVQPFVQAHIIHRAVEKRRQRNACELYGIVSDVLMDLIQTRTQQVAMLLYLPQKRTALIGDRELGKFRRKG